MSKESTTSIVYRQMFLEIETELKNKSWTFLFTDGSKIATSTSFSLIHSNGTTITRGVLDEHCSIFSAEATAIKEAAEYANKQKGKFVICSDSRSTINAIENIRMMNPVISRIRDLCIKNPNIIRLMWVPGHSGIHGNELADKIANDSHLSPSILHPVFFEKDITNEINTILQNKYLMEWANYNHRYSKINTDKSKTIFSSTCTRKSAKIMSRLRIGHTKLTHAHILTRSSRPDCIFCFDNQLTVDHILDDCVILLPQRISIFGNVKPSSLLHSINNLSINMFIEFLCKSNLLEEI